MISKKVFVKGFIVLACLFLISAPTVLAQDCCLGDIDCDQDVDGTDAFNFKQNFFRFDCPPPPECPCPAPLIMCDKAFVPKTGRTQSLRTGDDGDLERGFPWPNPRFTDNLDGTVTDNLTGLIWLKNANCFGVRNWSGALSDCNTLHDPGYLGCELDDGSSAGDWRLPNRFELESLLDLDYSSPALPNTAGTGKWTEGNPFTNVQPYWYWSSTTKAGSTYIITYSWAVELSVGHSNYTSDGVSNYVWPVRGGQ